MCGAFSFCRLAISDAHWHSRCNLGVMKFSSDKPTIAPTGPLSPASSSPAPVSSSAIVALVAAFVGFLDVREPDRAAQLWDVPALILGDTHVHGPMSIDRLKQWLRNVNDGAEADTPPDGQVLRVLGAAGEERVLSAEGHDPQGPLRGIVVERQLRIVQKLAELVALLRRLRQGGAHLALR
jgi:hypothetical protein